MNVPPSFRKHLVNQDFSTPPVLVVLTSFFVVVLTSLFPKDYTNVTCTYSSILQLFCVCCLPPKLDSALLGYQKECKHSVYSFEKRNEWKLDSFIPFLNHIMFWYFIYHSQPPGFPFAKPDYRLNYLCSWSVVHGHIWKQVTYIFPLRLATRILTYRLSCSLIISYTTCIFPIYLEIIVTLPKCSDDPGNSGGTDFFCRCTYHKLYERSIFLSSAVRNCSPHRLNKLASHRWICKALLLF